MIGVIARLWKRISAWFIAPVPAVIALSTERLRLRELVPADAPAMYAYRSDAEVMQYLARGRPNTPDEVQAIIAMTQRWKREEMRTAYILGIELKDEGWLIGECHLTFLYPIGKETEPDAATIGFILHRDCWGRGYATEATRELIRFAFADLGFVCVYAGCLPENTASRRVLEKAGMCLKETQQDFPGSPKGVESLVFCIDRAAWQESAISFAGRATPPPAGGDTSRG